MSSIQASEQVDEFEWLEEVEGKAALDWVRAHNVTNDSEDFKTLKQKIREILDSNEKIPYVEKGPDGFYYNLWKDKTNVLGLWRRTSLSEYKKKGSGPISWETVLDVDEVSRKENKTWVWHGAQFLREKVSFDNSYRCLISLSRGGADADETREFNLTSKEWSSTGASSPVLEASKEKSTKVVTNAFFRPESKGALAWKDENTVYVYTDFGPDASGKNSLTESGYPRIVKEWKRGQPLKDAKIVYEGLHDDMFISASYNRKMKRTFVSRTIAFYNDEVYLVNEDYSLTLLAVPNSANKEVHNNFLFLELRKDWKDFVAGSLIATDFNEFLKDQEGSQWDILFSPKNNVSLSSFCFTENYVVMNLLDNVKSKIVLARPTNSSDSLDDNWLIKELNTNAGLSSIVVTPVDSDSEDTLFLTITDFLTPSTLSLVDLSPLTIQSFPATVASPDGKCSCVTVGLLAGNPKIEFLKSLPSFFESKDHMIEQLWATSDDGTKIPYFCVRPKDMEFDSFNPTLLYGYGGFEVAMLPYYAAGVGTAWLNHTFNVSPVSKDTSNSLKRERKGTFVLANIRGGSEFGPSWHQAALKGNRHKAYQDFSSVAKDLVSRKITQPKLLGCNGGSNGGLLTGNMLTQYADLFGAIVIQVPLLDMKRYNKLLAGASWMAEYGNPDIPEEWAFLKTFSPYHLLQERPDIITPPTLITTSTRDDRVHPSHARKMAALMLKLNKDITYYENIEGGHGGAANSEQQAHMSALLYCFLWSKLRL